MVKRRINAPEGEPETMKFEMPSEKEHLFQCVDVFTQDDEVGKKLNLDDNTVSVKIEVVGGEEEGRTMLNRTSLKESDKGFFATRLFLKAVNLPYKGGIDIDTDDFIGRQFYATVKHSKTSKGTFANIEFYNFEKIVEQPKTSVSSKKSDEIAWDS